MGLCIAEALAITAGTEFMYGVSMSAYLRKHKKKKKNSVGAASSGRKGRINCQSYGYLKKHLPSKGGQSDARVRRPGDDVEHDDHQCDLCHLPLILETLKILH